MITKASVVHKIDSNAKFSYEEIELQSPSDDEILIKHYAIGVNFIDTYFRRGIYPYNGPMPLIVGAEATGEIVEKGKEVKGFQIGDRVAYTDRIGSYAQHKIIKADRVVKIPDALDSETVAASMLKGLTVQYLIHQTFPLQAGHTVLFHAASGGVGLLAGQWASSIGAILIGTVSTEEKAEMAKANGYQHIINYKKENFVEKVKEITGGKGVDVVYDSVGQDTYPHSLKCLKRLGHWVSFGQSSGLITNFNLHDLAGNGSLSATRPRLFDYIATKAELNEAATSLFNALTDGRLNVTINQKYSLEEANKVHQMLQGRQTKGSTILLP